MVGADVDVDVVEVDDVGARSAEGKLKNLRWVKAAVTDSESTIDTRSSKLGTGDLHFTTTDIASSTVNLLQVLWFIETL